MKRSEVLNQLVFILDSEFPVSMSQHDYLAEKLLRAIEEVGMLPPTRIVHNSCGCCSYTVEGEWENEA